MQAAGESSGGALIGVLAPLLQKWGNPGNTGICVACFERDIAGAVGLHRAAVVQYMRPEIIGFVLGSLIAACIFTDTSRENVSRAAQSKGWQVKNVKKEGDGYRITIFKD